METVKTQKTFPSWTEEMRDIFRGGMVSQFILHRNIHDLVPGKTQNGVPHFLSLRHFLHEVLFRSFDTVLHYDRGRGITLLQGEEHFRTFLQALESFGGPKYSHHPRALPREPNEALDLVDRFLRYAIKRTVVSENELIASPLKVALIVNYVQYIVPRGEVLQVSGRFSENLIRFVDWASDSSILGSHIITVLVADNLSEIADDIVQNPHNAKIAIPLPNRDELFSYLQACQVEFPALENATDLSMETLAERMVGLSRVNVRNLIARAIKNSVTISSDFLAKTRKSLIEKECAGLLEFIETSRTLDDVAGHTEAKAWLREDTKLIQLGKTRSLPMGYLLCGRIGTGKTYLATCWAGEIGIPCVVLKNFRDRWQGSTEGNLEKIFGVLHALGQVLVFVDEADQATGRRGQGSGDSGVSGRVYAMLAQEMANTKNRGRILWVFATSRPDLLEVDLKRTGRLDVHIPLFPPQDEEEKHDFFFALTKKVGLDISKEELPKLPAKEMLGGNEMESILVRAARLYDLQDGEKETRENKAIGLAGFIEKVIKEFRPSSQKASLEYMDVIAALECTDTRFLPPMYQGQSQEKLSALAATLRRKIGL